MQTYFSMNSKKVKPDVQKTVVIKPKGICTDKAQSLFRSKSTKCYVERQGRARKKNQEAQDKPRESNYVNTLLTRCKPVAKHLWVFVPTCG